MRKDWEIKTIGEVCKVIAGQSPEGKYYNDTGNGLPFYQGKKEYGDKYIGEPKIWTTKVTKEAEANDILMSVRAPVGPINLSSQKICIGRGLAAIRASKFIENEFLYYFLMKHENEIVGNAGAVFNSINKAQIEGIKIPLPSLSEQQEIVSILDDAFESIDRAKSNAELNLKNAKELILSSTIKYFNCLDSVEFLNLEDLTDIITDYVANGSFASLAANVKYKREKDYAVLLRLLDNSRLYQGDFVYINEQAYEFLSKSKIYPNDIIISNVGARLGTVFRAPDIGMPMSLGPNSVLIRSKIYGDYLFCWLASPSGQKAIKDIVAGAGQPKFNKTQFRKIQVPVPKDKKSQQLVIDSINQLTNKAEKLEEIYLKKIKYLEDLKKAVLQKAFNGELKTSKISA
jgi:type I restriction enzyme S subunit